MAKELTVRDEQRTRRAHQRNARSTISKSWLGSAWQTECTLHQLSPYIGKTKSTMAASLIKQFTKRGDIVYDPFSGCGTVALEAWLAGREVRANDLSPYASLLTRAKLMPYETLDVALEDLQSMARHVDRKRTTVDLRSVPIWVRDFFHTETLQEVLDWTDVLKAQQRWFLLACLMGILHHQRPGFLSFPSSHTVPYLRVNRFPRSRFRQLYEYRSVFDRLEAKVMRAYRRLPNLDFEINRQVFTGRAERRVPAQSIDAIVTSPPYMRQLDYGRDNRLRLSFLGCRDWQRLDERVSPGEKEFLVLMRRCFKHWSTFHKLNGKCVLVIGDGCSRTGSDNLPRQVADIAKRNGYSLVSHVVDLIPNERRVRRGLTGNTSETIMVFRNTVKSKPR